jgi:hypothetical protein
MIRFSQDDLCKPWLTEKSYDAIICNGLLGGPLLHRKEPLVRVIGLLAQKVRPGGILLAADCFHQGWKQLMPPALINEMLTASGLQTVYTGEGLGVVRPG